MTRESIYDLLVIGGGINGVGVARDAAGRGLSVCLCEQDDLAAHTSSASTKLIHGGLRYLEQYDFRLVRHALQERRHLLRIAPHIVHPQRFILPHHLSLRPRWMIRLGLFLYDRLAGPDNLPGSGGVDLTRHPAGQALKPVYTRGFEYSDCRVQDARLVVVNAMDARQRGADIRTRSRCIGLKRHANHWDVILQARASGLRTRIQARAIVNAGGPWVEQVETLGGMAGGGRHLRFVKGSHLVVPRLFSPEYAYIFQHTDGRVLFAIPFEQEFTLLGTTEVELDQLPETVQVSRQETDYICEAVSHYLRQPVYPEDVVWSFSGVRPLFDAGPEDASKVSREYHLHLDRDQAPILSIHGGKITTYRRLAEEVMELLSGVIPPYTGKTWTDSASLPGGDLPGGDFEDFLAACLARYPQLPPSLTTRYAGNYGSRIDQLLGDSTRVEELGHHFGNQLFEREVRYLVTNEFAETADDIVWRRTRCGLGMSIREVAFLQQWLTDKAAA
ncbi:MAG: glycerol-3-phosphate dehydrogenase [Sedimenticola sp.]|nr:glycerol-3-phosphate dehydrogenase [Sedimenticola sp.]